MKCNVASVNHKGVRVEFVGCFCVGCYGEGERDLEDEGKINADLERIEAEYKLRHKGENVRNAGLRIRKVK